ncbi:uncharacterized protein LOC128883524 isoform X2 [Hylaeus volcanicus]|uniref:uncharacterized protein LOC128883524 isoform X2 n=1 Tax=Hylaeus volcanicus TaxID=313075 RepID=UPI0023B80421|nr:uncharacterized protein LOC128883524 isoform X2 [Hylaeus volcanicus]
MNLKKIFLYGLLSNFKKIAPLQDFNKKSELLKPGPNLEITPHSAVIQLDENAKPVKLIPNDIDGAWELPTEANQNLVDMSQPRTHILPNGLPDPAYDGTNIYPGTLITLDGFDYLKQPRPIKSVKKGFVVPSGTSILRKKDKTKNQIQNSVTTFNLPKTNDEITEFPKVKFDLASHNVMKYSSPPPSESLTKVIDPFSNKINSPSLDIQATSVAPSVNSANFNLKDLTNLFSLQFKNFNLRFPTWNTDSDKIPNYFLSPKFSDIAGMSKILKMVNNIKPENQSSIATRLSCVQNYSRELCPIGWERKDRICLAPHTYMGACAHIMDFSQYTKNEMRFWASECNSEWPCIETETACLNKGQKNYSTICPRNWRSTTSGCVAPSDYKGQCTDQKYRMDHFTQTEKEKFEKLCSVSWPCTLQGCEPDYRALCPFNYKPMEMNEGCVVLNQWNSTCEKIEFDLYNASYDEKSVWTRKCNLTWPCMGSRWNANKLSNCRQNYSSPCPADWIYVQSSGLCKLPDDFFSYIHKPKCLSLITQSQPKDELKKTTYITFDFWSVSRKQELSDACSVFWPCIEDKKFQKGTSQSLGKGCPNGFRHISSPDNQVICESLSKTKTGACAATRNFANMSKDELTTLSNLCSYTWGNSTIYSNNFLKGADIH